MMNRNSALRRCLPLILALCLCLPQVVCAQEAPELLEPAGVKLDTFVACVDDISKITVYDASVIPYVEELFFPQEGVVDEIHAVIGQEVKAGDLLITLNQEAELKEMESIRAQIEALEADDFYSEQLASIDLSIMEVELRALRNQSPADETAIALKLLDIEELKLDLELETDIRNLQLSNLRAKLEALEAEVSKNALYAPFDGRVVHMAELTIGSYIGAYTPFLFLADDSRLSIKATYIYNANLVSAHDIYALIGSNRYAVTPVEVDMQEYIAMTLSGETLWTEFTIDQPDEHIASGMYAAVCLESQHAGNALVVPTNSLYQGSGGHYVYVIEDGVRVRRNVRTGVATDTLTQITEGLEEGAVVYVKE